MREYAADLRDAWEVFQAEVEGALTVGSVVLLASQLRFRGKGSGVDAATAAGHMVKFRDGRIVHMLSFRDPEGALEAIGLGK